MEREISIILKVKGAESAKKAVQDVFNQQTTTLVTNFNQATAKTGTNMGRVAKTSKQASTSMQTFTKTLGRGMAALYLYNRAWAMFGTQFESGLQLQRASAMFEQNVGNVTTMLPELRSATRGVVADFDLLKTATRAFQQGIKPQQMASTFKMATVAAQRLGLNATDAISTITSAITKQDEGALNTLGIITNVNQAYKTQTALVAKSGGVMSKAMSIQLRQSLILRELQSRFGGANQAQEDGLMVLDRFRASWKNFRAEIGTTLGIALIPLTRALTGVLDLTTKLLSKLNQTGGFQKFVQIAMTLAGVLAGAKFIAGTKSLLTFLGVLGGAQGLKMPIKLGIINKQMAKLGGIVTGIMPKLGQFSTWIVRTLGLSVSFARVIPGWGTAIAAVLTFIGPLTTGLGKLWTATKVLFQLLNNFDEKTGLSKVLRKDAEELGGFYNLVETVSKAMLITGSIFKGIWQGISEGLSPLNAGFEILGSGIDWVGNKLEELGIKAKTSPLSSSWLDQITNKIRMLVKVLGLGASAVAMFIPGLQVVGGLGVAGFGTSILNDMGMGTAIQGAVDSAGSMFSGNQAASQPSAQPQTSTQISQPAPRAMNLENSEDSSELLRKMSKILEKQTDMMETDSQKQDIRESQSSARNNIMTRR